MARSSARPAASRRRFHKTVCPHSAYIPRWFSPADPRNTQTLQDQAGIVTHEFFLSPRTAAPQPPHPPALLFTSRRTSGHKGHYSP